MIGFNNIAEEDLVLFQQHIENKVMMRRAQAIVRMRQAARLQQQVGGQREIRGHLGELIARPKANIDPIYYYSRMGQEREANVSRLETHANVWEDPDFLTFELKRNPELRPQIDSRNAPVHMNGIELPSEAAFKDLKAGGAKMAPKAEDKLLIK